MNRICKNTIALGVMLAANICNSHAQDFDEWIKQEKAQQKQFTQQHNTSVKQMQAEYNAFVSQTENEFAENFEKYKSMGKLGDKSLAKYGELLEGYKEKMKGYTHKDQKPFWT